VKCIGPCIFHFICCGGGFYWNFSEAGISSKAQIGADAGTGLGAGIAWNNPALLGAIKNEHDVIMIDISNIFLIASYSSSLETKYISSLLLHQKDFSYRLSCVSDYTAPELVSNCQTHKSQS
jgi:hypothetical protein